MTTDHIEQLMSERGASADPTADSTRDAVDINTVNVYEFMTHAEAGTGGFRTGTYLVPHDREMFYRKRRQLAFYKNFTRPVLRAMIDPVFSEDAPRRVENDDGDTLDGLLWNAFLEDCDGAGHPLQTFTHEAMERGRLHGVTFVVVENFGEDEQPATKADAIDSRIYPYVYLQSAHTVDSYDTDRFGNLTRIAFAEPEREIDGNVVKVVRQWTETEVQLFRVTGSGDKRKYETIPGEEPVEHGLGLVPVVPVVFGRQSSCRKLLVDPPLYDIARINHAIYNKTSEMREIERAQEFAVFYVQTDDAESISLGTHNFLAIPTETSVPPGFASPDPGTMTELRENEKTIREDLFRIAEQQGVTGVTDQSGVAKQWDFFAHESVLRVTSNKARTLEDRIAYIFRLWTGEQFFYMAEYPDDFSPADKSGEVDTLDKLLLMELPPKAAALVREKAFRAQMADQDQVMVEEAVEQIRKAAEDETQAKRPTPEPPQQTPEPIPEGE